MYLTGETTERPKMLIGGAWVEASSGRTWGTINPYDRTPWATVPDAGPDDVDRAVNAAHDALRGEWGSWTGFQRAAAMRRLADTLQDHAEPLAQIEARDNGKLLREAQAQVAALPQWLHYFAGVADKLHGETIPSDNPNYFVYTRREPVGVVAAIVPWNSPLSLMMWKLAPALAAGCTVVVKPSDNTPTSALAFAECVEAAGLPAGVFNVLPSTQVETSKALVAHPMVDKVAFTGSTAVGIQVAQSAAGHLARVSLELGGKSAQLVFDDADVEAVVNGVVAGVFAASGQTCIAGSRLIVHESLRDGLVARLRDRCTDIRMGDPLQPDTDMGPLVSEAHFSTVSGFVDRAVRDGARLVCGGPDTTLGGYFVGPTILEDVDPRMEIAREEVFGPVLAVMGFTDEDAAVRLANASPYALGAGVWTGDVRRAHRVAAAVRAGTVWVNCYRTVAPYAPFGGMGHSGWGRENGHDAVHEYTETKTVWVETQGVSRDPFVVG